MSIYDTPVLLRTVRKIHPVVTFFKNRYFPTGAGDVFPTTEVLIEYKEGKRKLAPFVIPRKGGITMEREGYTASRYTPPYIAPQRPLTIDDLNKKGFGESLYSNMTPQQRQAQVLGEDLADLSEMIDRREEWMCKELLTSGEVVMKHYSDRYGVGVPEEKVLRFYNENFDNEYTVANTWDDANSTIYDDLDAMVAMLTRNGNPASDLCMDAAAWKEFIKDSEIKEMLNNRRIEMGMINPVETPDGVAHMGQIIVRGKKLDIFVYDEMYEDEEGEMQCFMPYGTILITAPGMGRMLYGAITQIEQDGEFHTYDGSKVPKYFSDSKNEVRELRVASAPVPVPNDRKGWVVSKVL